MIGIVVATHGELANAFINTAEAILGRSVQGIVPVSSMGNPDTFRKRMEKQIRKVSTADGVLILTDMFGGTASDMSYSFFREGRVEIVSAANLPILLKALDYRDCMDLKHLSGCLEAYGKRSISVASDLIKGCRRTSESKCPISKEEPCSGKNA